MGNRISETIIRTSITNSIANRNNNVYKLGRWGNKTIKQSEIAEYWTNIDHCGDIVCGDLQKTKEYYEKEILKLKK